MGDPFGQRLDHGRGGDKVGIGNPHGQHILTLVLVPFQAHGATAVYFLIKIKHANSLCWQDGLSLYGVAASLARRTPAYAILEPALDSDIR